MKAFDLYATLGLDSSAFKSGLSGASGQFNTFASSMQSGIGKINQSIGSLLKGTVQTLGSIEQSVQKGVTASSAAFTAMLGGLATTGVKYNSMMENYQMDFTTLLQDADKAAAKVEELRKLDLSSPLDMGSLANATKLMLSFGVAEEEASDKLTELSDIAMGNADKLNSMALAYSQIRSVGKLTMIDLRQMANQGFNPLKVIAEQTGVAIGDLQDFMSYGKPSEDMTASIKMANEEVEKLGENASVGSKMLAQMAEDGYISADIVSEAITIATSKGGQFYKASENAAKTLTGQLSILQGGVKKLVGSGFEPLSEALTDTILPNLNAFVDELDAAFNRRGGGAEGLTGMLTVVRDELVELREETDTYTEKARKSIVSGSVLFNNTTKAINGILPTMVDAGEVLFEQLRTGFKNAIPNISKTAETLAPSILSGIINTKSDFLLAGLDILGGISKGIIKDFGTGGEGKIRSAITGGLKNLAEWMSDEENTASVGNAANSLLKTMADALIDNAPTILAGVGDAILRGIFGDKLGGSLSQALGITALTIEAGANLVTGDKEGYEEKAVELVEELDQVGDQIYEKYNETRNAIKGVTYDENGFIEGALVGQPENPAYVEGLLSGKWTANGMRYKTNATVEDIAAALESGTEIELPSAENVMRYEGINNYYQSSLEGAKAKRQKGVEIVDEEVEKLQNLYDEARTAEDYATMEKYQAQMSALSAIIYEFGYSNPEAAISSAESIANGETTLDVVITGWETLSDEVDETNTAMQNVGTELDAVTNEYTTLGEAVDETNASIQETITLLNELKGYSMFTGSSGENDGIRNIGFLSQNSHYIAGHETGLNYVPYDEYLARLHEGEAVLTREEAKRWRRGEQEADVMVVQQESSQRPIVISIDGTELATVLYAQTNRRIEDGNLRQIYGMGG